MCVCARARVCVRVCVCELSFTFVILTISRKQYFYAHFYSCPRPSLSLVVVQGMPAVLRNVFYCYQCVTCVSRKQLPFTQCYSQKAISFHINMISVIMFFFLFLSHTGDV